MGLLAKISVRFEHTCSGIDQQLTYALKMHSSNIVISRSIIAFCVIKLHDQWNARCRELILKSALGNCSTLSGRMLPGSTSINPLQQLRNTWSPRKAMDVSWEPEWHVPAVSERAARLLNIANYSTVANAISAITVIEDLRWTRNSMVHELPRTYRMFRVAQLMRFNPAKYCPSDYAVQRIPGTINLIIDGWMDELKLALRAAIK